MSKFSQVGVDVCDVLKHFICLSTFCSHLLGSERTDALVVFSLCFSQPELSVSYISAARSVVESAPTWLSPKGSSSSMLVLLGEELLLECIAAGV